jgi:hypothetical protein
MAQLPVQARPRGHVLQEGKRANGMIELILTVCAIAQPATCIDKHVVFDSGNSPRQCTMAAQPFIARWVSEHPEWIVQRWKCQVPKSGERDL